MAEKSFGCDQWAMGDSPRRDLSASSGTKASRGVVRSASRIFWGNSEIPVTRAQERASFSSVAIRCSISGAVIATIFGVTLLYLRATNELLHRPSFHTISAMDSFLLHHLARSNRFPRRIHLFFQLELCRKNHRSSPLSCSAYSPGPS